MRLALVTETYPPEVNGVSMTLGKLCAGLVDTGWEVQVVRPVQEAEEYECVTSNGECEELIVPGVPLPGYKGLRMGEPAALTLFASWWKRRPDIVHIATEGPLGLAALAVARFLKLPLSSTFHTNFDQYTGHYRVGFIAKLISAYLRAVHNACGCTLAPTRQMAEELASMGYRNMGVFSRGVDTKQFTPELRDEALRSEWGASEDSRVFLYVGRVAREKNIDLALASFATIHELYPKDKMVVVGDGPELARLKREYPYVCYAGMRKGEALARHYASGDIFLFPSVTETFGNVVTEAMASGLAVTTYDYAAGRQCIESGLNGCLASFGDEADFKRMAIQLREMDTKAFGALRREARATANSISWERVVASFKRSALEVIGRYATRRIAKVK